MRALPLLAALLLLASPAWAQEGPGWTHGASNPYGHVPIAVFVVTDGLDARGLRYVVQVEEALAYWAAGGNGALAWNASFSEAPNASAADLVVVLVDDWRMCGGDRAAGCGAPPGEESPGFAVLALRAPHGGRVEAAALRLVAIHEVGHALGLGHSSDPTDVMYPSLDLHGVLPEGGSWTSYLPFAGGLVFATAVVVGLAARARRKAPPPDGIPPCTGRGSPYHDLELRDGERVCTLCGYRPRI